MAHLLAAAFVLAGCTQARIGGATVCVHAGLRCRPRYERIYRTYGFTCARGSDRLRPRDYIGTPLP
jgi:hypothetical protein